MNSVMNIRNMIVLMALSGAINMNAQRTVQVLKDGGAFRVVMYSV